VAILLEEVWVAIKMNPEVIKIKIYVRISHITWRYPTKNPCAYLDLDAHAMT
jgi:hypothetical protein